MNKYKIKRFLSSATGVLNSRWKSLPPGLYVFNYHRIGDANLTKFDPNVFSSDVRHFEAQVNLIASRFRVINAEELIKVINQGNAFNEPVAMITFDDGYADNYLNAFPVLKKRNVSAIFFLPTNFIGTDAIPWWDEVAWLVRNTGEEKIVLPGTAEQVIIDTDNVAQTIRTVLRYFKDHTNMPLEEKLAHLRDSCGCQLSSNDSAELFMSWQQAKTMLAEGMDIGSHTQSHRILSHLDKDSQRDELGKSREILMGQTGFNISTLAYPVGGLNSYTKDTIEIARQCGYQAAFNFVRKRNLNPSDNPYDLGRIPVDGQADPIDIKYSAAFTLHS